MTQNTRTVTINNQSMVNVPNDGIQSVIVVQSGTIDCNCDIIPIEPIAQEDGYKTLKQLEALYGEYSYVAEAVRAVRFNREHHRLEQKHKLLIIPETRVPYAHPTGNVLATEETVGANTISFADKRTKISSLSIDGTVTKKFSIQLTVGTIGDKEDVIGFFKIPCVVGDNGITIALAIAEAVNERGRVTVKPFVPNVSFTKYKGTVATLSALIALANPTDFDVAYVTAEADYFYYKRGRWLKTYINPASIDSKSVYFIQVATGGGYNSAPFQVEFFDENGLFIDGDLDITTQSLGLTSFGLYNSIKTGDDIAGRAVAGVGKLDYNTSIEGTVVNVEERVYNMLADLRFPMIYFGLSDVYSPIAAEKIKKLISGKINNPQCLAVFPITNTLTGDEDSCDAIFYNETGLVSDVYQNAGQVVLHKIFTFKDAQISPGVLIDSSKKPQLYRSGSVAPVNVVTEVYATYSTSNVLHQQLVQASDRSIKQNASINLDDIFPTPNRSPHIQNCVINTRCLKVSFINYLIATYNFAVRGSMRHSNTIGLDISDKIIDANQNDKYPVTYGLFNDDGMFMRSSTVSLTDPRFGTKRTAKWLALLIFNTLCDNDLRAVITNHVNTKDRETKCKIAVQKVMEFCSRNHLSTSTTDSTAPMFDEKTKNVQVRAERDKNELRLYTDLYINNELIHVSLTVKNIQN